MEQYFHALASIIAQAWKDTSPARPQAVLANWEGGQARKGTRRMPRHQEATKDVAGCEKYR